MLMKACAIRILTGSDSFTLDAQADQHVEMFKCAIQRGVTRGDRQRVGLGHELRWPDDA